MKQFLLLALLLLYKLSFSQEINLNTQTGYAFGETSEFKKIMLFTSLDITYELQLKNDYFLSMGVGASALKFSYVDAVNNNVFASRYFLEVPFTLKRYFFINERSTFYLGFGGIFNYCLLDKKMLKKSGSNKNESNQNLGFDLGIGATCAYKRNINNKMSFAIGLSTQHNYLSRYKNASDKIDFKTNALTLSLFRKTGRK